MMDALRACGFGGVVTNVHPGDGFVSNPDNLRSFAALLRELDQAGLDYWIYDEQGYPSGFAGGEALTGHPELEAKGFYMRRKVAYEPCTAEFRLDMESDRIVWAAKYPLDTASPLADGIESRPCFDRMQPVPFSAEAVSCALEAEEILYVFCVKSAYEGSHCTHNVCSHKRYINVMDPRAVRRFIDLCYEPIACLLYTSPSPRD